jgi:hypothetical protein
MLVFFHWFYEPPWVLTSDFISFMIILQTVGPLGRVISSSQSLYLNTGQHKHRINTYTYKYQTSMPCVGFEPTIPASERADTVHALDRSATVTGFALLLYIKCLLFKKNCPSASCASADTVYRGVEVFGTKTISINYITWWCSLYY